MAIHVVQSLCKLLLGLSVWFHYNSLEIDRKTISAQQHKKHSMSFPELSTNTSCAFPVYTEDCKLLVTVKNANTKLSLLNQYSGTNRMAASEHAQSSNSRR